MAVFSGENPTCERRSCDHPDTRISDPIAKLQALARRENRERHMDRGKGNAFEGVKKSERLSRIPQSKAREPDVARPSASISGLHSPESLLHRDGRIIGGEPQINIVDLETGKGIIERTEHVPARPRGRPTPIGKTPGPSTQCEDETMASERANRFGAHIERTPITIQGTAFNEGSPFVGETGEHINGLSRLGVSPPGEGAESQVGDAKAT